MILLSHLFLALNVTPNSLKQNSKRAATTALFYTCLKGLQHKVCKFFTVSDL